MKILNWQVGLGLVLILASTLVYALHYFLFHDAHHLFMFLVGDIAFVFIEVLLVTMILHKLLEVREKRAKLKKLNMVIGSFFSEVGNDLLKLLSAFDRNVEGTRETFRIDDSWTRETFSKARRDASAHQFAIESGTGDLIGLCALLRERRDTLLRILENPNMLEHERFTDLLWGVFHLGEELGFRRDLTRLGEKDMAHLSGDMERAYTHLICEWLAYMEHLKEDYPYLFSLARRLNPFDPEATAEIC